MAREHLSTGIFVSYSMVYVNGCDLAGQLQVWLKENGLLETLVSLLSRSDCRVTHHLALHCLAVCISENRKCD